MSAVSVRTLVALAVTLLAACEPGAPSGGSPATPVAEAIDVMPFDGAAPVDAGDAGGGTVMEYDAGPDASIDAGTCECPALECQLASCIGETCDYTPAPDGTACLVDENRRCIDGACSYGVCGDGYREPGADPAREPCDDGNLDPGDACAPDCTPTVLIISSEPGQRALPGTVSVAADDAGHLLFVWASTTDTELELRARRYDAAGVELVMDEVLILDATLGLGWDPHAAVVGLASGWAVVWAAQDGDASEAGIRYTIVPISGAPTSSRRANEYELGRQAEPAVARTSTGFLVAWADESGTATPSGATRLRRRAFDPTGRALGDETALSPDGSSAREVALASNGDRVLAAWTEDAADPFARPNVVGLRLGGAGPDATPFTISATDGAEASAAFLPSNDFAVTFVSRTLDPRGDVHARLVHASGDPLMGTSDTTLTSTPMGEANVAETAPRVLPLGAGYVVTYEDGGASMAVPPRSPSVQTVLVDASPLAPELPTLAAFLRDGLQGHVTLLSTARGAWFAWSDAGALGDPAAHRSFVAYLLPPG